MICAACSKAPKIDPEKSLLAAQRGLHAGGGGRDETGDDQAPGEILRHQGIEIALAGGPLDGRAQRPPLDDDDRSRIHPLHRAGNARSLTQKRREQPGRPYFAVPRDDVAHRLRRRTDEAHGLQHARDVPAILRQRRAVSGLLGRRNQLRGERRVPSLERCQGGRIIAVRPLRQIHQRQQRIGHTPARGQDHGLTRLRTLDDVGDAAKTSGIGDARATKLMYDPCIHNSHALPARRSAPSHDSC